MTKGRMPVIFTGHGYPMNAITDSPAGSPRHIARVKELLGADVFDDNTWGIGHALWAPLSNMYPDADIPVVLLSVDVGSSPRDAFELGRKLAPLRDEGALIFASGNIVHEVDMVDHDMKSGFPWAEEFSRTIKELTLSRRMDELFDYKNIRHHELAVPTVDHYYPLLTALGASDEDDDITVFNDFCELGSLSMTSFIFG